MKAGQMTEYTDPERFKVAQKDWASLSEKQRACEQRRGEGCQHL
jgi:hypothetical protein